MSDEFDKEAEREKLREKFAEDEKKREHTQRMSELLLQGATMTNRHCETCGDPIFRHDGREFCPTCHATEDGYEVPAEAADAAGDEPEDATPANGTTPGAGSPATAVDDAVAADDEAGPPAAGEAAGRAPAGNADRDTEVGDVAGTSRDAGVTEEAPRDAGGTPKDAGGTAESADAGSVAAGTRPAPAPGADAPAGVGPARESLTRTLTRFARAAEEVEDPRRAREHLRAAREAAEALSALER
ncbi:hypothetical protein DQW50_11380 [Halorubrum sp. 48-1-W]|uniref:Sjogren's syndrome/scleroderma autoantigen 1 family protein n=1 Tax=Halorubrum sp. 48-1-W TaxID=2249761 RepID=UPI000DCCADE7|nr:Sjogren's syndrome/scleroderma autoantigen 1 family protein [Halorubrum sp. 48-1-W]RAW45068.1 hypothetical protein DQW50_11380 [Halorubrum sp. 48-1-W]